jgi:hypothetical protein
MRKTSREYAHELLHDLIFCFSLVLLLISCAKAPVISQPVEGEISPDLSDFEIISATQSLKFEDTNPKEVIADKFSVGVSQYIRRSEIVEDSFSKRVKYDATSCTASLLEDGHVITAAHCVPKSVLDSTKSCRNLVFLNKNFKKPYRCEAILWYSSIYQKEALSSHINSSAVSPDVVIYKLSEKPKEMKPMRLSSESALDSMRLSSLLYTPKLKEVRSLMKESRSCRLKDSAHYGYAFRVIDQEFVQGNSGSPIINEMDEIQFIVSSVFKGKGESFVVDVSCLERKGSEYFWKETCSQKGPLYFKSKT